MFTEGQIVIWIMSESYSVMAKIIHLMEGGTVAYIGCSSGYFTVPTCELKP
jgi:hypothetical protein